MFAGGQANPCVMMGRSYVNHANFLLGSFFGPKDGDETFFETSVDFEQAARRFTPEERTFYNHRCENIK
jgi:hypothetical protein